MSINYTYADQLESERLVTRFLNENDEKSWSAFFKDKEAVAHFPSAFFAPGINQAAVWNNRQMNRYENENFGLQAIILKETNELIGQCGLLTQEVEGKEEVEVGYHLIKKYWGQGYAPEAAKLFIDYAFKNDIAPSVISIIDVRNLRSQRVAEKNGLVKEKQTVWNGLDVLIYRITK